jgi:hypothetical protein
MNAPLILTLALDVQSFNYFNQLRKQYFPPERNFLSAHLTLFHHLPPFEPSVLEDINSLIDTQTVLVLQVKDVVSIGNGVAFKIDCPPLNKLHLLLQNKWQAWLTPQDRQKLWPHITVQNKVAPAVAKQTLLQLKERFESFDALGIGLSLYAYEGGPWKLVQEFPFRGAATIV